MREIARSAMPVPSYTAPMRRLHKEIVACEACPRLVAWRQKGMLRRLRLTPLPLAEFATARVIFHLIISLIQAVILLTVGRILFGVHLVGNVLALVPLILVGGLASLVFVCGALAQVAVGRLVEKFPPHILFAVIASLQFLGVLWAAQATGKVLIAALAVTMAAIYAQVTVNDLVIARYTADAWRGRVYAVRYFLTFLAAGAAVTAIAVLHGRGGFGLVLGTTAMIALGFVAATAAIAVLVNAVEKQRARAVAAPAE